MHSSQPRNGEQERWGQLLGEEWRHHGWSLHPCCPGLLRTQEDSGTADKLHLLPSPTKPASVAVICFLKMITADSSAQKPGYTQGWLKRHCRGQKVGQSSLRSQGRVNHVRVLHFFQSAGYHRSPPATCTSQYPQAELKEASLSYTREDLGPSVSWSLPTPLTHTEENIARAEAEPKCPQRS